MVAATAGRGVQADAGRQGIGRHRCYSGRGQQAHFSPAAAVQQHLTEIQVIPNRRHHPAAARQPARPFGDVGQGRPLAGRRVDLRLCQPADIGPVYVKARRRHAQRLGDTLLDDAIEVHSRDDLDNSPEDIDGHAVFPDFTRLMGERQLRQFGHHLRQSLVPVGHVGGAIGLVDQALAELAIDETGGMAQQILHRHGPFLRLHPQHGFAGFGITLLDTDLEVLELRQVLRDGRRNVELAFFSQCHCGYRNDRLGHRRDPKNRIRRHWYFLLAVLVTEGAEIGYLVIAHDQHDRARQLPGIDIPLKHPGHPLQPVGREADLLGMLQRLQFRSEGRHCEPQQSRDKAGPLDDFHGFAPPCSA